MKKLFVITGPTAIGKSDISVQLAVDNASEIISADSMQVYRKFNIGTGKITPDEMCGIRHHLIDVADPDEDYSVGRFVSEAETIIDNLSSVPIVTGGTGLYISSLLNGSDFGGVGKDESIREKWKSIADEKGKRYVYEYLKKIDPESAEKININDVKRTIRAIEIFEISGVPKSKIVKENNLKYDATVIILYNEDRDNLYENINKRVDKMFSSGLVDEVESLMQYKNRQSMQAIGYKETAEYIEGKISSEEAKQQIKQNSRNYAKRQITYFNGMRVSNKIYVKNDDFFTIKTLFSRF